jgi:hypothetical protein
MIENIPINELVTAITTTGGTVVLLILAIRWRDKKANETETYLRQERDDCTKKLIEVIDDQREVQLKLVEALNGVKTSAMLHKDELKELKHAVQLLGQK